MKGDYISYSGTVLDSAPQKELALKFFAFMLSEEGRRIFRECGQEPLANPVADDQESVPMSLRKFIMTASE